MKEMPYFMTNEEWYVIDPEDDECAYKLTDKAPQEAIDSYNDFRSTKAPFADEFPGAFSGYVFE